MRILVTGATGDLGARVVERLLAEGHEVVVASRRPFRAASTLGNRVRLLEWHPSCDPAPEGLADGIEAIAHLAGGPLSGIRHPDASLLAGSSRLAVAERLAAAFRGRPVRVVAASIALPSVENGDVMTEGTPRAAPRSEFERQVLAAEAACTGLAYPGGATIVRLGVLMRRDGIFGQLAALARYGVLPRLDGALIPIIDPDDAAAMLVGLIGRSDFPGTLLGVAPEPLRGEVLAAALSRLGPAPIAVRVGARLGARRFGPLSALLFNRIRVVPQRLIEAGAGFVHPEPGRRLEELATDWEAAQRTGRSPWVATLRGHVTGLLTLARS